MLEIGAGHFARLEVVTQSRYKASIVREMIHFAKVRIDAVKAEASDNASRLRSYDTETVSDAMGSDPVLSAFRPIENTDMFATVR